MASSLTRIATERKAQLRNLTAASKKLDARQEALEREIKRLVNRKKAVPEIVDAERLASMAQGVEGAFREMVGVINSVASAWGQF